jgi:hypothetical protein
MFRNHYVSYKERQNYIRRPRNTFYVSLDDKRNTGISGKYFSCFDITIYYLILSNHFTNEELYITFLIITA